MGFDEESDTAELYTLTRGDDWGDEAFRDVGEATFCHSGRLDCILATEGRE